MHDQYKLLACCVLFTVLGGCKRAELTPPSPTALPAIIPAPRELTLAEGQFVIGQNTPVSADAASRAAADYFVEVAKHTTNLHLRTDSSPTSVAKGVIRFELTAAESSEGQ